MKNRPCKAFKNYLGIVKPKKQCCIFCWYVWHWQQEITLLQKIDKVCKAKYARRRNKK